MRTAPRHRSSPCGLLVALVVRGIVRRSAFTIRCYVLRRLRQAAGVFVAYYIWLDGAQWTSGLATFVIGFAIGLALTRTVAERKPTSWRKLSLVTTTSADGERRSCLPRGMTDACDRTSRGCSRRRSSRLVSRGDRAVHARRDQAVVLAQLIERSVVPSCSPPGAALRRLRRARRQQSPSGTPATSAAAGEGWTLRATALQKMNMRLLRQTDEKGAWRWRC